MINLRYHIVSIAGIFLALGIGAALGSTFLGRYTVNQLDTNIRSAENRIQSANAENARLSRQTADAEARDAALIQFGGRGLLEAKLTDVPVVVVVANGVDQKVIDGVRTVVDGGGADLRGILQVREGMRFATNAESAVAAAVGTDPKDPAKTRRAVFRALRSELLAAGRRSLGPAGRDPTTTGPTTTNTTTTAGPTTTGPTTTTTTTTTGPITTGPGATQTTLAERGAGAEPDGSQPALLSALLAADDLRFIPGPAHDANEPILETTGYRFVFLSAAGLDPADVDVMVNLLPAEPGGQVLAAVVVSPTVPASSNANSKPPTPSAVARVRTSPILAGLYSTVDNVETFSGLVASVVTLDEINTQAPGHYGQGDGATSILPPPP